MPSLDPDRCRSSFVNAPVATLATHGADGVIHLVPVTFGVCGAALVTAVDHKPKRTSRLQRLLDVERDPNVSLLVEHHEDDWERLWWVRAEGRAAVLSSSADLDGEGREAFAALVDRYPQYTARPPVGPVVEVTIERWVGWAWQEPDRAEP